MQIADERAHVVLSYLVAMERQGHRLSVEELNAFADDPDQRMRSRIALVEASRWFDPEPAETVAHWLQRLHWLRAGEGGSVEITALGRAVLRELDLTEQDEDQPVEIVLSTEDPIAYTRVIARIMAAGEGLLVDPYLTFEHVETLARDTRIARVLTGSRGPERLRLLSIALGALELRPDFEVRTTDEMHDRFVVPPSGPLDMLGTSIGGIGKRLSMLVQVPEPVSGRLREELEAVWKRADPLTPATANEGPEPIAAPPQELDETS